MELWIGHLFHLLEAVQCQLSVNESMGVLLPHGMVV